MTLAIYGHLAVFDSISFFNYYSISLPSVTALPNLASGTLFRHMICAILNMSILGSS
jgi:hypothetical protein